MNRIIFIPSLCLFSILINIGVIAQYYTPAQLTTIDNNRSAFEGDFYLDTINNVYKIGLTNGRLGDVSNAQSGGIDSMKIQSNYLKIYSSDSLVDSVDLTPIQQGALIGDVKFAYNTIDHNGWYLLDGRLLSLLSLSAQTNATSLGFITNLPNANDRVLKHPSTIENNGDIGGSALTILTQANLPNLTLTGTTDVQGAHSHNIQNMTNAQNRMVNPTEGILDVYYRSGGTTTTTEVSGTHTHTVTIPLGGAGAPISNYQPYMAMNVFIFLGL